MKDFCGYLLFIFLILISFKGTSQTRSQLSGTFSITKIGTSTEANCVTVEGDFMDPNNVYSGIMIAVGDEFIDGNRNAFRITQITSSTTANIQLVALRLNDIDPIMGKGVLYRPTSTGYALAAPGISDVVLASALNTNAINLSTSIPSYSSGTTPPVSAYAEGDPIHCAGVNYILSDSKWKQLGAAKTKLGSTPPAAVDPEGTVIKMSGGSKSYYYSNGSAWILMVQVASLPELSSFGDVFYNTAEKSIYMMSAGAEWAMISNGDGGAGVTTGTAFPDEVEIGDLFYNTEENVLYLYTVNEEWKEVSVDGSTPTGAYYPSPAKEGQLFFNTEEKQLFVYNGSEWATLGADLADGHIFVGDASNKAAAVQMSGDATLDNTGVLKIADKAVTDVKLDKANIPISGFGNAKKDVSMGDGTTNWKITNLKTPTSASDATTKGYVDNMFANPSSFLPLNNGYLFVGNSSNMARGVAQNTVSLSGFGVPTGDISMGGFKIIGLANPVNSTDAVHKSYVDNKTINPININLPFEYILVGNSADQAAAVAKNNVPFSEFGAAKKNVALGDGTTNYQINNLADPTLAQDAATKNYVDTKKIDPANMDLPLEKMYVGNSLNQAEAVDKNTISLSDFGSANAAISMGDGTTNYNITNLLDPTSAQDATTKNYVDNMFADPSTSLSLTESYLFVGNSTNKAEGVAQSSVSLSGFGAAESTISMGDGTTNYNITNLLDPTSAQDAATKNYVDNAIASISTQAGDTNPSTGNLGDVFYNTTEKIFYVYDGTEWVEISTGGSGSTPTGPTNPAGAVAGDVFYNTTDKIFYVFDGTNWVEVSSGGSVPTGNNNPTVAEVGDVFYNTGDDTFYVYDGTTWQDISSGDNLGNHTATADIKLGMYSINNDGGSGEGLSFDNDGRATFAQDVTVNGDFYTPSDERLKTNIETLSNVLEKIENLRGVQFEYKDQNKYATGPKVGVIAQELQKLYPDMVTVGADNYLKVDYTQLTGVLLQAVKEQQAEIVKQQAEIDALKRQDEEVKTQLEELVQQLNELKKSKRK